MNMKSLTIILTLMCAMSLSAQAYYGTKSYEFYEQGGELVKEFDNLDKEIVRIEYDLVFDSKETYRDLSDSWEYTIVAFADDGVKDLDIKLYKYDDLFDEWTMVDEDQEEESYCILTHQPESSGQYKVEVIVYEFEEGYSAARYGLIFLHD